ncbi:MAG: ParA family protein [Clostridiales bacterium]|nr:ParA family protein [Clostridiales bacterium]
MGKIIAVANQKGGVGKTTTNVNLSACLAALGKRVLTIDIDPQGNTTSGLGIEKSEITDSTYEVLIGDATARDAIIPTCVEGLDLLPSNINLVGAEIEMTSMIAREHILKEALNKVKEEYDFILIDCPPSLGLLTLNALTAADKVLVPIQCEFYALEGLSQLINTVNIVGKRLNPSLSMEGVVLTMYDPRTKLSQQVVGEVKNFFNNRVYDTMIPRNVRLGEAPSFGLPITLYDPNCTGAKAYMALAQEVIDANCEGKGEGEESHGS